MTYLYCLTPRQEQLSARKLLRPVAHQETQDLIRRCVIISNSKLWFDAAHGRLKTLGEFCPAVQLVHTLALGGQIACHFEVPCLLHSSYLAAYPFSHAV